MIKIIFPALMFCTTIFLFNAPISAKFRAESYPDIRNEMQLMLTLRKLYDAQNTYQETVGNGDFGTQANLINAGLLDWSLDYPVKNGYLIYCLTYARSSGFPAKFVVSARPVKYRRTGRRSFHMNELGVLRAGDREGNQLNGDEPVVRTFPYEPLKVRSDIRAINALRTIHSAEVTYQATGGNGNFATLSELYIQRLIVEVLGRGKFGGYDFLLAKTDFAPNVPADFKATATPSDYNYTGIRSFYIDATGVIRGADKNGSPADINDLPIE